MNGNSLLQYQEASRNNHVFLGLKNMPQDLCNIANVSNFIFSKNLPNLRKSSVEDLMTDSHIALSQYVIFYFFIFYFLGEGGNVGLAYYKNPAKRNMLNQPNFSVL